MEPKRDKTANEINLQLRLGSRLGLEMGLQVFYVKLVGAGGERMPEGRCRRGANPTHTAGVATATTLHSDLRH